MDGKLVGYNTDCEASLSAIEDALRGIKMSDSRLIVLVYSVIGSNMILIR